MENEFSFMPNCLQMASFLVHGKTFDPYPYSGQGGLKGLQRFSSITLGAFELIL